MRARFERPREAGLSGESVMVSSVPLVQERLGTAISGQASVCASYVHFTPSVYRYLPLLAALCRF
jgi:hypothetical protein